MTHGELPAPRPLVGSALKNAARDLFILASRPSASKVIQKTVLAHYAPTELIIKSADFFIFSDDPWGVACPETSRWKRLEKCRAGPIHTCQSAFCIKSYSKKSACAHAPTEL
jgi:hypothetical protein